MVLQAAGVQDIYVKISSSKPSCNSDSTSLDDDLNQDCGGNYVLPCKRMGTKDNGGIGHIITQRAPSNQTTNLVPTDSSLNSAGYRRVGDGTQNLKDGTGGTRPNLYWWVKSGALGNDAPTGSNVMSGTPGYMGDVRVKAYSTTQGAAVTDDGYWRDGVSLEESCGGGHNKYTEYRTNDLATVCADTSLNNPFDAQCSPVATDSRVKAARLAYCQDSNNVATDQCFQYCNLSENVGQCDTAMITYCNANPTNVDRCGCLNIANSAALAAKLQEAGASFLPQCNISQCSSNANAYQTATQKGQACPSQVICMQGIDVGSVGGQAAFSNVSFNCDQTSTTPSTGTGDSGTSSSSSTSNITLYLVITLVVIAVIVAAYIIVKR